MAGQRNGSTTNDGSIQSMSLAFSLVICGYSVEVLELPSCSNCEPHSGPFGNSHTSIKAKTNYQCVADALNLLRGSLMSAYVPLDFPHAHHSLLDVRRDLWLTNSVLETTCRLSMIV